MPTTSTLQSLKTQVTRSSCLEIAIKDLIDGLKKYPIWVNLSWQDIRLRYRRSYLGPFWITLSMIVTIYSMGFIYARLFKANINQYLPYIASGILTWTFVSGLIGELTDSFTESGHFIKQIKLPYSIYILRIIARNLMTFLHNFLAILPLLIYFKISVQPFALLFGFFLLFLFGLSYGIVLAILGARFRISNLSL